ALERAVEPGVTRDTRVGQGNGLSGTFRIARATGGWLNLQSGAGELRVVDVSGVYAQTATYYKGTVLDFTLPTTAEVDIADALWGHEPTSSLELSHTTGDEVVFKVRDESSGFGNRGSGREIANKLSNLMTELPGDRITIDFEDVDFLTAS